jgi:hypothetical protein
MNKSKFFLLCFIFFGSIIPVFAQQETALFSKANDDVTAVIVYDVFSPPVASRIYFYSGVAAYETVLRASPNSDYVSLSNQLNGLKELPFPSKKVVPVISTLSAFYNTALHYVFSEEVLKNSFVKALSNFDNVKKKDLELYKRSVDYGKQISDSIFQWSKSDGYAETRKLRRYSFSKSPGKWTPTPPAYMAAVEPYWGKMRTAVAESSTVCTIADPESFSTDTSSSFYRHAKEVYEVKNNLSEEQTAIANFWDCNPFNVNTNGHLMFAVKKISPGAHWLNIVLIASKKNHADLMKTTAAYVLTGIAVYDAIIHCWAEKYKENLIRPETYINNLIDANWRPLLQTPPFPEYPSGHSVISFAAATVLTDFFGDNFSFNDDSENNYGLPARQFSSFINAANEAAISRLYGGIHYREAIENGQSLGKKTGEYVLKKIKIKK